MAVKIRLKREGAKGSPQFRIVVADGRAPKEGKVLETIGTYEPLVDGDNYQINLDKAEDWISKGAQPSDTVRSLLKKARKAVAAE